MSGTSGVPGDSRRGSLLEDGKEVEETDADAIKVVRQLAGLKMAKTVMDHVEVSFASFDYGNQCCI